MAYPIEDMLVVGITSRALFALDEADAIYRTEGLDAYRQYQLDREDDPLSPGTAFPLVRGLLAINAKADERLVEVVVISKNDADSAMRFYNSIEHHSLDVTRGAFTSGRDAAPYLRSFHGDLFLSAEENEVVEARRAGFPAALICPPPENPVIDERPDEVLIAFDGDAVLFDDESERVYQEQGLEAFLEHEAALADEPMNPGPFEPFLRALKRVQDRFPSEGAPIRTALVTARNAPAIKRVVNTLRSWGVRVDESFFLGGVEKAGVLQELRPHIFFDDQESHLAAAQKVAPSAHVVGIPSQMPFPAMDQISGQTSPTPSKIAAATKEKGRPKETTSIEQQPD